MQQTAGEGILQPCRALGGAALSALTLTSMGDDGKGVSQTHLPEQAKRVKSSMAALLNLQNKVQEQTGITPCFRDYRPLHYDPFVVGIRKKNIPKELFPPLS